FANPIGYSAGYYAYIWSEMLARDTEHWFKTHGGLKRENGDLLRANVLYKGLRADALTIFQDFYGKAPSIAPLLEARGLTGGKQARGRALRYAGRPFFTRIISAGQGFPYARLWLRRLGSWCSWWP